MTKFFYVDSENGSSFIARTEKEAQQWGDEHWNGIKEDHCPSVKAVVLMENQPATDEEIDDAATNLGAVKASDGHFTDDWYVPA